MASQYAPKLPDFDGDGYATEPDRWSDESTRRTAVEDGLGRLSPEQWRFVHTIHRLYDQNGAWPGVHQLCHQLHSNRYHLDALFGNTSEAYRLAGVPNPGEEAKSYL